MHPRLNRLFLVAVSPVEHLFVPVPGTCFTELFSGSRNRGLSCAHCDIFAQLGGGYQSTVCSILAPSSVIHRLNQRPTRRPLPLSGCVKDPARLACTIELVLSRLYRMQKARVLCGIMDEAGKRGSKNLNLRPRPLPVRPNQHHRGHAHFFTV